MRAVSIYEKFKEESDPISDLGIGFGEWLSLEPGDALICTKTVTIDNKRVDKGDWFFVCKDPKNINNNLKLSVAPFSHKPYMLKNVIKNCQTKKYSGYQKWYLTTSFNNWRKHFKIIKVETLLNENLNEKFTQDSDPIKDLGIGRIALIKKWLSKHNISDYKINSDESIDLYETIILELSGNLPVYINFNETQKFYIHGKNVTSLKGCPKKVNGDFSCSRTNIKTLKYCPKYVNEYFYAHDCQNLKSLIGIGIVKERLCVQRCPNINVKQIKSLIKSGAKVSSIYYYDLNGYYKGKESFTGYLT